MTDPIDDLARHLFALEHGARRTGEVTAQLTGAIVAWALSRGWAARTEARVGVPEQATRDPRLGFVDVIVRIGGDQPDLAIEIDSADKPWSVTKLQYAAAGGMRAVWVRWGDNEWAGIYDDVDVIQLRALRRPAFRSSPTNQLELWR